MKAQKIMREISIIEIIPVICNNNNLRAMILLVKQTKKLLFVLFCTLLTS